MNKKAIFAVCLLLCCGTATLQAQYQYQLPNSGFESWDTTSYNLPIGWNSYNTANCNIQGMPANYAATIAKIINSTVVHSRTQGSRPGGKGGNYITLQSRNVNASGINMTVSGIVSTGRFNIGSISVYTPLNYFSTERKFPSFRMPLTSTPDSMYLWVRYYAVDADSSRARIVAYIHGDTDFQYMNHTGNKALYCGYIHHLMARTDSVLPATRWVQLRLPFKYDGKAKPKYLLMYMASDSCIIGGKIGNELSVDDIELIYSSWLKSIMVDGVSVPDFKKDVFSYQVELPYGTSSQHVPSIRCIGEVDDITDSVVFYPSLNGVAGGRSVITVIAEDGVSTHTYTLTYQIAKSPNAHLSALTYDKKNVPGFHRDSLSYEVWLAPGTTVPPVVECQTEFPGLKPQITQATALPGAATVKVTAEDGHTQLTYTINFKVSLSKDATASWIRYNQQPLPGFHPDSLNYSVELPYGTTSVQVTAAANWPKARARCWQVTSLPGTAIVQVVAEDTTVKRNYRISFSVAKNNNARLDSLYYMLGKTKCLIPAFHPDSLVYSVVLPEKNKIRPVVAAVPQDARAKSKVLYPLLMEDTVRVWVIAENGSDSLCYKIAFRVRRSTNALLSSLKVNGKPLANFKDTVFDYPVLLDSSVVPFVEALPADSDAQVRILFPSHIPGTVTVTVTAEDTSVHCVYRLYFSIRLSDNADLMSLGYRLGQTYYPLENFHKDTLKYHVLLPPFTTVAPVLVWVKADFDASDTVCQPRSPMDSAYVTVVSESGHLSKKYIVHFDVPLSRNASLEALYCDGRPLAGFHPDTLFYTVWLHPDTVRTPMLSAKAVQGATFSIRQAAAPGDTALLTVRAQDTMVVKVYRVLFLRKRSSIATLSSFHYRLGNADSVIRLQDGVSNYTVLLKERTTDVPFDLQCVPTDSRASVKFLRIPLSVNDTAVVRVLAEDGVTVTAYIVAFRRIPSADALLDSLWVNGSPLKLFRPDRFSYSCGVPGSTQEPPVVTAKLAWEADSVYITQPSSLFGTAQIRVVAEDGEHYNIYTVQFRPMNAESRLMAIYLDGGYPVPHFNANVQSYALPYGPSFPKTVTAVPLDSFATSRWSSEIRHDTMDIHILCLAEDTFYRTEYLVRILLANGIAEAAGSGISVYPNPVQSVLCVRLSEPEKFQSIQIYSSEGRLLRSHTLESAEEYIQVQDLPCGVYYYRVLTVDRRCHYGKFVRQ